MSLELEGLRSRDRGPVAHGAAKDGVLVDSERICLVTEVTIDVDAAHAKVFVDEQGALHGFDSSRESIVCVKVDRVAKWHHEGVDFVVAHVAGPHLILGVVLLLCGGYRSVEAAHIALAIVVCKEDDSSLPGGVIWSQLDRGRRVVVSDLGTAHTARTRDSIALCAAISDVILAELVGNILTTPEGGRLVVEGVEVVILLTS